MSPGDKWVHPKLDVMQIFHGCPDALHTFTLINSQLSINLSEMILNLLSDHKCVHINMLYDSDKLHCAYDLASYHNYCFTILQYPFGSALFMSRFFFYLILRVSLVLHQALLHNERNPIANRFWRRRLERVINYTQLTSRGISSPHLSFFSFISVSW